MTEVHEDHHPGVKFYTAVAAILTIITVAEVAVLFVEINPDSANLILAGLYVMMAVKFAMVVAYFMHLRYDPVSLSYLFAFGLVMALGTLLAIDVMMKNIPPLPGSAYRKDAPNERVLNVASVDWTAAGDTAGAPVDLNAPLPEGDAARGAEVFVAQGCGACHTTSKVPGATGTVGPNLDGLAARAGSRVPGLDGPTYIRQSVEDPGAFVVEGYMKVMPNVRPQMSDQEFADLLAFLESL